MSKILLASNEQSTSAILSKLLKTEGYKVVTCHDTTAAQNRLKSEEFNLMIMSASKSFDPDLSLLKSTCKDRASMPVVAILEPNDTTTAITLNACPPFATIEKPLKVDKLLATVQKAIDFNGTTSDAVNLNLQLEKVYQFEDIVSESPAMKSVCDMISRVSGIDVTIMLVGEPGTGKSTIAETIHANSSRKKNKFCRLDCANPAIEKMLSGEIAECSNGTLFLRNVGLLPAVAQEKLLKIIKDGSVTPDGSETVPVNVRVITSTSQDLEQAANNGKFNKDLMKVLKVILIRIQPLRSRPQDIMPTVRMLLQKKIGEGKVLPVFEPAVVGLLEGNQWHGNMEDIEKVLDHAISKMTDNKITVASLPANMQK